MQGQRVLPRLRGILCPKTLLISTSRVATPKPLLKQNVLLSSNISKDKSKVPSSSIPQQVPIITKRSYSQLSLPRDVSHAELVDILKTNSAVVVDVRTPQELSRHGDIPGAINIPLGDLEVRMERVFLIVMPCIITPDSVIHETKEARVIIQNFH